MESQNTRQSHSIDSNSLPVLASADVDKESPQKSPGVDSSKERVSKSPETHSDLDELSVGEQSEGGFEGLKARYASATHDALRNLTKDEYLSGRQRRFGTTNPEVQDIPFYNAMIKADIDPW